MSDMLRALMMTGATLAVTGCIELPEPLPAIPPGLDGAVDARPGDAHLADTGDSVEVDMMVAIVEPGAETCNGLDDDQDGVIDEGLADPVLRPDAQHEIGQSRCRPMVAVCIDGAERVVPDRFESDETACDGQDNDCDGEVDEAHDFACVWCDGADGPPCNGCPERTVLQPTFRCIPPGSFAMGSPQNQPDRQVDEGPVRTVRFSRPYQIAATEAANGPWLRRLGGDVSDPSWFSGERACDGQRTACPFETVSWFDALWLANNASIAVGLEPCYTLEACEGTPFSGCADGEESCVGDFTCAPVPAPLATCDGFRLPTEAEWARAARAGTNTRFWIGDTPLDLASSDYFTANSQGRTWPANAHREVNAFGLQGVHGNVSEWVFDGYAPYPDPPIDEVDPVVVDGERRVVRGGHFGSEAAEARSASRSSARPERRSRIRGLRFAASAERAPAVIPTPPQ